MPKISVIIPVYNGAATIGRLCEAIKAQTFTDFRVTIIDNASEDETGTIARQYANDDSRFVHVRHQENLGFLFSYTRGYYSSMDCDYMVYLSSGDLIHPDYFKECVEALDAEPSAVLAYSYCQFVKPHDLSPVGAPYQDNFDLGRQGAEQRYFTIISRLALCTAFYGLIRTSTYARLSTFLKLPSAAMDNVVLAALALEGPFIEIPKPLLIRIADMAADENYAERYARLKHMAKGFLNYNDFAFHHHIQTHFSALNRKYYTDLTVYNEMCVKTAEVLYGRYQTQLEAEVRLFIEYVSVGNIYGCPDNTLERKKTDIGDFPFQDLLNFSILSGLMETFHWLATRLKLPRYHLTRAILYLWQGRRGEALATVEQELALDPTSRQALEIKAKLQKMVV